MRFCVYRLYRYHVRVSEKLAVIWRALCVNHSREDGLIINVVIAGDFSGVGAVHLNDFRKIIIDGIKSEILIFAPRDGFLQGFTGSAGPEDKLVSGSLLGLKVFN